MKIAICDDDYQASAIVLELAQEYAAEHPDINMAFSVFDHAEDLLESAQKHGGFDIYILDIVMPDINGIELGTELRKIGFDGKIIYLTSSEEFAVDSYKVKAFNYILKPVNKSHFIGAFNDAISSILKTNNRSILVKTPNQTIRIPVNKIMYAQLFRRAVSYYLADEHKIESILIRTTFTEAVKELTADPMFILCGKSTVVNLYHITAIGNDEVTFKNNQKIYMNSKICRELRSLWSDYWINKED